MYKFTIIAYAGENYSPDPLFKSLLAFPDPDLIQLIVTDATADALYRVYFEEAGRTGRIAVRYLACPGKNIAECYNLAIPEIKGEYTAFVDTDSEYSDTCLSRVRVVINSPEFTGKNYICVMPYFVGTDDEPLLYKICPRSGGSKDIRNNPSPVILCLYAYFIRTTLVCGMRFREDCPIDARQMFILDLMEKETVYYLAGKQSVFYRHALENTTAFFTGSHEKVWYTDTLKHVYLPYIKERYERGELTLEQEEAILYLIYARFSCNMNQSDKKLLDEQEIREFYEIVHELLRYIHYDVIVQRKKLGHFTLPVWLVWDFMKNKARLCGDADGLVFSGGSMLMDIN
ncbi:MAG: glycosyltransferase family 2 protein, partial [Lachnospiraceae bacterium]|nr:glycosyltransferase family 2 protein [Lachnospiraceae bacterium]